ncbi:YppG-like protein [Melghiribacillus thermohalophilus]|uniref:YppG-like protein n=1 Tax=Melghiribacillus thermohalophilus TaxID=1324956 RepID=A0A4R3MXS1_9BACI|nr:YppG family protein [Melghiribacillus thermohalophilus]TCT20376.1 YppG-like protein [Melghiribacillus thermohalophilus]
MPGPGDQWQGMGIPYHPFVGTGLSAPNPSSWQATGMGNQGWNMPDLSAVNQMFSEITKMPGFNQMDWSALINQSANPGSAPYQFFQKPPQPFPSEFGTSPYGGANQLMKGGGPILASFMNEDGQIDFDKLFSTVGQMVSTVNQLTPLLKGFSSLMKGM